MSSRFRKAICTRIFHGWEMNDVFRFLAGLGYDGVKIDPYTIADSVEEISPSATEGIRQAAGAAGLEVVGIHSVTKSRKRLLSVNHPDPMVRAAAVEQLKALIELCGDLGGRIMVLGGGRERMVHESLTARQAWDHARQVFSEIVDVAEARGVTVCLEPLSRRLTNFITRTSEAIMMVEEVGHPCFKMMLDVRSASDDEAPIPELIRRSAPHLAHFHANDSGGGGPGTGSADYEGICEALREIGYGGYLSVEVFDPRPDPEIIARESLGTLGRYFD